MTELIAVWAFLQQLGQVSTVGVLIAVFFIWKNDLAHLQKGVERIEKMLLDHLSWHSQDTK